MASKLERADELRPATAALGFEAVVGGSGGSN